MSDKLTGRVHSIQSMGTLDGPGVRFVIFMQGCDLRCKCCHNPDTWDFSGGKEYLAEELIRKASRYREYFGVRGGITLSGGEPLCQAEFCAELFRQAKASQIGTCLDTSGFKITEAVKQTLFLTDRVLLDIKYTADGAFRENVGCGIGRPLEFLDYLSSIGTPTTLRQVIIPTLNDTEENILALKKIANEHRNVDKIELLPFRKICQTKYDSMGLEFPLASTPTPTLEQMNRLNELLK